MKQMENQAAKFKEGTQQSFDGVKDFSEAAKGHVWWLVLLSSFVLEGYLHEHM